MTHPVQLEVLSPVRFDRIQLLLRLAVSIVLGWIGITAGWMSFLLFVGLPVFAAILVSTQGAPGYVGETGPQLWRALRWLIAFWAYMLLLTDRFPVGEETNVQVELQITGQPTTGSTLLRLLTSLPSAFVLSLLGVVSWVLFVVGVVTILLDRRVPSGILGFQRGILRWTARLLAYHASLVDEYPPFAIEQTHHAHPAHPGGHATAL